MIGFFKELHPVLQALLATLFTWGVTALGAAAVFLEQQADSLGSQLRAAEDSLRSYQQREHVMVCVSRSRSPRLKLDL